MELWVCNEEALKGATASGMDHDERYQEVLKKQ